MKKTHVFGAGLLCCMLIVSCAQKTETTDWIDGVFTFAASQYDVSVKAVGDTSLFPVNTDASGAWKTTGPKGWTSGFFPGCLWLLYERTGDEKWKTEAAGWTNGLEDIQHYTGNHDVGFMIYDSYGEGYRLTQDPAYKDVIIQAAKSLATRYNDTVGCIMSWNPNDKWSYPVIVDNMMNLELLFWASKNGGPRSLYDIAFRHAETTMKNHFRPDGSSYHVVDYDPETGEVNVKNTHQGYADDSCWSRGQAWGIYGFSMVYRETGDKRFLETACLGADFFLDHLPDDNVPYWDFNAPMIPDEPRDTSAAAITASALLELAESVESAELKSRYKTNAVAILQSLAKAPYIAEGSQSAAVLLHGVASLPHGNAVDRSLIYGDYYFMEALLRLERGLE